MMPVTACGGGGSGGAGAWQGSAAVVWRPGEESYKPISNNWREPWKQWHTRWIQTQFKEFKEYIHGNPTLDKLTWHPVTPAYYAAVSTQINCTGLSLSQSQ